MQQREIVFLINSLYSGGAEKVLSTIITELVNQNYNITLILLEKHEFYPLPPNVKKIYLSKFDIRESSVKKLLYIPILALKLKKYIIKNRINLVQSHMYRANYINILSKLFGSKHKVQIVNTGAISRYKVAGLSGKINLKLIKYLYKKADLIISKSKGMQIDMMRLFNFKNRKTIINNPYDVKKIEELKYENITEFIFKKDIDYLISIARFDTFKRQDILIEALLYLDKNIELILIGEGKNEIKLKELTKKLNLEVRVHFLGRVENPYKYLYKSKVFVLSSSNGEGFPNVLVEAMLCKVAVISSDCISGPREILSPTSSINYQLKENVEITSYGILFPIIDVKLLVKSINYILKNKNKRLFMIERAYSRALEFSLAKIVNIYKKELGIV